MDELLTSFDTSNLDLTNSGGLFGDDVSNDSPLFGVESNPLADLTGGLSNSFDGQTVSPADVSRNSSFVGSVPNSAAMTNLTSPDINFASPYQDSLYETSPMYGSNGLEDTSGWYSLFPDATPSGTVAPTAMQRTGSHQSQTASSNDSPLVMGTNTVDKSPREGKRSPTGNGHRRQSSGVSKPRRRPGPLKTIEDYDTGDKAAMKRARNTMAARVSRQRKVEHIDHLEAEVSHLRNRLSAVQAELQNRGYDGPLLEDA